MKIGIINYINSIPFGFGMEKFGEVVKDTPRNLAAKFFAGELDFSFVPAIEYIRMRDRCYLVEGVTISSFGPTNSVYLYFNGPIRNIVTVKLSSESRSSNFLVREILEARYGIYADYIENGRCDAEVIIGDKALEYAGDRYTDRIDLGWEWMRMTGLPVVYAVCVADKRRNPAQFSPIVNSLTRQNLHDLPAILQEMGAEKHFDYLTNLNYSFDAPHRKALEYMTSLYHNRLEAERRPQLVSA